jgi:hypothetical protein
MSGNHHSSLTRGGGVLKGFETDYLRAPNDLLRLHLGKTDGHGRLSGEMYVAGPCRTSPPSRVPLRKCDLEMPIGVDPTDPQHHTDKPPEHAAQA